MWSLVAWSPVQVCFGARICLYLISAVVRAADLTFICSCESLFLMKQLLLLFVCLRSDWIFLLCLFLCRGLMEVSHLHLVCRIEEESWDMISTFVTLFTVSTCIKYLSAVPSHVCCSSVLFEHSKSFIQPKGGDRAHKLWTELLWGESGLSLVP